MRAIRALFEIEFHEDGDAHMVLPRERKKGGSWFTLFWATPKKGKAQEHEKTVGLLNRMIAGKDRLPRPPKRTKLRVERTKHSQEALTEYHIERDGYAKVVLEVVGEEVVVLRDDEVELPRGVHNGVPTFTVDEMVRLKWFVGMKPDPEMMCGVWLLKKHLGAGVAVVR